MKQVEIRIKGYIDQQWSEWFGDLAITHTEHGETTLTGSVQDQSALYGILTKMRNLGLSLVAVNTATEAIGEKN